jgi:hypothetical protein
MAVICYDRGKNYEEEEVNAIDTEYLCDGLLPDADVNHVRVLLKRYVDQRVMFYVTRSGEHLRQVK